MTYEITHATIFDYSESVSLSHHTVRLQPRTLPNQRCLESELRIQPRPAVQELHLDYFGNRMTFVTVEGAHKKLIATSHSRVEVRTATHPEPAETPKWEAVRDFSLGSKADELLEAREFIYGCGIL